MSNESGKVAIVTGGASGIGYAIVQRLLKADVKVAVADLNLDKLKDMEEKHKGNLIGCVTNVTKEADIQNLVQKTVETFGGLDYAFNVAGASKSGAIVDQSEEDWDFTVDLCLKGVFLSVKHEAKYMKEHGGGAIVNVASLNAHVPMFYGAAYSSAKAGVEMLTKNAALELSQHNIRVNAILPGLVSTPLTSGLTQVEAINDAYMERIPMRRAGDPDEMAGPAMFLVSDDATYVNGASLVVDGAWAVTGYPDLSKFM
ncbi:SDR family NAD(P)-dependent oxidoreductase [Oceanobacillus bengalensis]|uniref:SDR family oxidoreductase n=1 Tax=Oceanobacillus bengalensis TaxID=1435466 RepID=A0A494Z7I0_9BACI|nr:SDR family NAD(P)-dependent oxidoreductase [Oceanobacillus bengalensis]RKQ18545.1 SDR family oxidoreductase [Oceanobacillus bengalensis]